MLRPAHLTIGTTGCSRAANPEPTRDYDRGEKFKLYTEIPTLREYLVVQQAKAFVEHYSAADSWKAKNYTEPNQKLELSSINIRLSLGELYSGINVDSLG